MAGPSAIRAGRAFVELFADDSMLVRTLRRAEARIVKFGENIKSIGRRLATLGVAAGTPFAISMKVFRDFDDQMRAVKAVTGATGKEFDMLTEKAKFLGRTTSFTASQVASAMLELGRAGFAPKEIDEAIPSVLNLARATGTELATSAEICANTLRSFELPASEMVRVSDVMVAAANNSAQTLEDLGESMSYCAPIASEYGLSLEQTAKALGSLANYGIKGSQAGTTLRRVLTNLADSRVQKRLQGIGVTVVDQDTGRMREVSEVLRDVGAATQTMAKDKKLGLFKQLFGLYAIAGGAKLTVAQFDKLIEAVDNAAGTGARAAKEMDSGIGGSLRMMWSAVEGVAIAIGEALAPSLQKLTDWFTAATSGMVKYLTKNKQLVVQAAKIITAITGIGIGLLVLGGTLITVGKIFGIVATVIASVAKIGLLGFSILSGAISAVTMTIGTVASAFAGIVGMVGAVFGGVASAVGTALSVLATVGTTVFGMIGTAIAAAFSPLGLVIISLGAVAGACFLVYRNASSIGNMISKVFQSIVGIVKNAAASVYAFLNRFTEFKIIFGTINIVRDGLHLLGQTILWVGNSIVKPVFSVIFSVFRKLAGIAVNVAKAVGSALVSGFQRTVGIVSSVFRGLVSIVTTVTGKVVSVVGNVFAKIASVVVRILSPVLNIIGAVFRGILRFISPIVTALKTVTGWIVSFARSFFVVESAVQVFSLFSSAIRGAASLFSTIVNSVEKPEGIPL